MTMALDGRVEVDDRGMARIAGTRMKVTDLVMDKIANHSTPEQMAEQFPPLTLAQIHAALAYYYDHKTELDALIEQEQRAAQELRSHARPAPSREELSQRLRQRHADQDSGR